MGIDIYDYDDLFDETDERLRKAIDGAVEDDREDEDISICDEADDNSVAERLSALRVFTGDRNEK